VYVIGKMIPVETIPEISVRTFVNAKMYPHPAQQ
jgi:hypothetical protein